MVADKAYPLSGARPFCRFHTQTFSSGTQKKPPRKSWSGSLMPRYLAPQETNWMLHFGPLPKQTMSGGFGGGAWLVGVAGAGAKGLVVVVCATAEARADKKSRTALQRTNARAIETSSKPESSPQSPGAVNW